MGRGVESLAPTLSAKNAEKDGAPRAMRSEEWLGPGPKGRATRRRSLPLGEPLRSLLASS
jgi:hypothetical protein